MEKSSLFKSLYTHHNHFNPISDPDQFQMMSLIQAALVSTRSSISSIASCRSSFLSPLFQRNPKSIQPITVQSVMRQPFCSNQIRTRNEIDNGDLGFAQKKKTKVPESLLHRLRRRKKALSVTYLTGSEWCEKQMEFKLHYGKYKVTEAMKVGRARHAKLEEEVSKKVKLYKVSVEDAWAVKFMNFLICTNQLSMEGLAREVPLVGLVNDTWIVGVIDEIRMPVTETVRNPLLVDTKTRSKKSLPAKPQKRNGSFQLMFYKYLWDTVVTDDFPMDEFFDYFDLNPQYILSEEFQGQAANSGFTAKTLRDLVVLYRSTCCTLPPAQDQLLLRYEYQRDHSLLGEDHFAYDPVWLKSRMNYFLEFWSGERDASYVPKEERWKCGFCPFASDCPSNTTSCTAP